jgi:hypothetical protein
MMALLNREHSVVIRFNQARMSRRFSLLKLIRPVFILLSSLILSVGHAHEFPQNSAQIILRDGQVEVRLLVDIDAWQSILSDPSAWLTGETDLLLTQADLSSDALNDKLGEYLAGAITLKLEQEALVFMSESYQAYETGHEDEAGQGLVEFRLSAQHAFAHPKGLSVQFPASLANVLVSVVQPQYGLVTASQSQDFTLQ